MEKRDRKARDKRVVRKTVDLRVVFIANGVERELPFYGSVSNAIKKKLNHF